MVNPTKKDVIQAWQAVRAAEPEGHPYDWTEYDELKEHACGVETVYCSNRIDEIADTILDPRELHEPEELIAEIKTLTERIRENTP